MSNLSFQKNPYITGNPVYGEFGFFGRIDILNEVQKILEAPHQNVVLIEGQRRIGKTSILLHLKQILPADQYTVIYQDLQDKARIPMSDTLSELADTIAYEIGLENLDLSFDNEGKIFKNDFLPQVYSLLPNEGHSLVFLFDEFDVLDAIQRERLPPIATCNCFFSTLRNWMKDSRLQFVFALGRNFADLDAEYLSAFKTGQAVWVSVFPKETTVSLITAVENLRYTHQAIDKIYFLTSGHPYFTQLICSLCFDIAQEQLKKNSISPPLITEKDIEELIPRVFSRADNIFAWIWDGLPPWAKLVSSILAQILPDEKQTATSKEIENVIKNETKRLIIPNLENLLSELVDWQLLERVDNSYCFLIPIIYQWVKLKHPFTSIHNEIDRLNSRADRHFQIAEIDYQAHDLDRAVRNLKTTLENDPNHLRALLLMGDIKLLDNQFREALTFYESAYNIAPDLSRGQLSNALLRQAEYLSKEKDVSALMAYYRLKHVNPDIGELQERIDCFLVEVQMWLNKLSEDQDFSTLKNVSEKLSKWTGDKIWVRKAHILEKERVYEIATQQISLGYFTQAKRMLHDFLEKYPQEQNSKLLLFDIAEQERRHNNLRLLAKSFIVFLTILNSYVFWSIVWLGINTQRPILAMVLTSENLFHTAPLIYSLFYGIGALLLTQTRKKYRKDERFFIKDLFSSFWNVTWQLTIYSILPAIPLLIGLLFFSINQNYLSLYIALGFALGLALTEIFWIKRNDLRITPI